jgi:hypothetical protein
MKPMMHNIMEGNRRDKIVRTKWELRSYIASSLKVVVVYLRPLGPLLPPLLSRHSLSVINLSFNQTLHIGSLPERLPPIGE